MALATFDPEVAEHCWLYVEFTIRQDAFQEDRRLQSTFVDRYGDNPDIVVDSLVWLDAENIYGQMTLSNAAALGMREVNEQRSDGGGRHPRRLRGHRRRLGPLGGGHRPVLHGGAGQGQRDRRGKF